MAGAFGSQIPGERPPMPELPAGCGIENVRDQGRYDALIRPYQRIRHGEEGPNPWRGDWRDDAPDWAWTVLRVFMCLAWNPNKPNRSESVAARVLNYCGGGWGVPRLDLTKPPTAEQEKRSAAFQSMMALANTHPGQRGKAEAFDAVVRFLTDQGA